MKALNIKSLKNKTAITLIAMLLMLSTTVFTIPLTSGDQAIAKGTHMPTYSYLNVFPNPVGIGQQVTLNIFLSTVFPSNEVAKNFYVDITDPNGAPTTSRTVYFRPYLRYSCLLYPYHNWQLYNCIQVRRTNADKLH